MSLACARLRLRVRKVKPPGSNTKREALGVYCPSRRHCAEVLHVLDILGVPLRLLPPRSSFLLWNLRAWVKMVFETLRSIENREAVVTRVNAKVK